MLVLIGGAAVIAEICVLIQCGPLVALAFGLFCAVWITGGIVAQS